MRTFNKAIIAITAFAGIAGAAHAANPDFAVYSPSNGKIWEIVDGYRPAAKFTYAPHYFHGLYVAGYTDRISRKEYMLVFFGGSGKASEIGVTVLGRTRLSAKNVNLPTWGAFQMFINPNDDEVHAYFIQNGRKTDRRIPLGTR